MWLFYKECPTVGGLASKGTFSIICFVYISACFRFECVNIGTLKVEYEGSYMF